MGTLERRKECVIPHATTEVWIDADRQRLDENTSIERSIVEVDETAIIVDGGFSRFRVA